MTDNIKRGTRNSERGTRNRREATAGARLGVLPPPLCQGPDPRPRKPKFAMPAGATDCHCHLFEDPGRHPLTANRSYTPPLCTLADYLKLTETLGVSRTVQVNASTYGHDNSVTLDLFCEWVPDEAVRRRILVDNPARLYDFQ